ncbi:MAG: hypothetical protein GDA52_05980 [Rhodobacteraceae bacterium]|nr:hypothetical protein [Paracoccaceae bacterium]
MKSSLKAAAITAGLTLATSTANASICDWRPSEFIGTKIVGTAGSMAVTGSMAAATAATAAATAAGAGATMLESTAVGAGAAGIMAGAGGVISTIGGTAVAVLTSPITIAVGAVTAVGTAGLEGGCYFLHDEIVREPREVAREPRHFAQLGTEDWFRFNWPTLSVRDREDDRWGPWQRYHLEDLYIKNGVLMNRDWGPNTRVVNFVEVRRSLARR